MRRIILYYMRQSRFITVPYTVTLFELQSIIWKSLPQILPSKYDIFAKDPKTQAVRKLAKEGDVTDLVKDGFIVHLKAKLEEDHTFLWENGFFAPSTDSLNHFQTLPKDVITFIARFLNMSDAVHLGQTSKSLQFLLNDESVWKHFCEIELSQSCAISDKSWKATYQYLSSIRFDHHTLPLDEFSTVLFEEDNRVCTVCPDLFGDGYRVRSLRFFERGRHQIDITIIKSVATNDIGIGFVNDGYNFFSSEPFRNIVDYMAWDSGTYKNIQNIGLRNPPSYSVHDGAGFNVGDVVTFDLNMDRETLKYYVNGQFKAVWNAITSSRLWLVVCFGVGESTVAITRHNSVEYPLSEKSIATMREWKENFTFANDLGN